MTDPTGPTAEETETTGHPRVDAALAELERIEPLPPAAQIDGYTEVHQALQSTLAALDEER